MDKKEEFDLEFDFEKEYGFDPKEMLGEEPENSNDGFGFSADYGDVQESNSDDELDELLSEDFLASLGISLDKDEEEDIAAEPEIILPEVTEEEYAEAALSADEENFAFENEATNEDILDEPVKIYVPASEPAFELEPELGEDFTAAFEKDFPSEPELTAEEDEQPVIPAIPMDAEPARNPDPTPRPRRRRKMSMERMIKEVYLPPIIAGLALILILTFIGGAISRAVKNGKAEDDAQAASNAASSSALQTEAELLMAEAEALANGYDYEAAIAKLESFSGEMSQLQGMMDKYNAYTQAKGQLVPYEDYASIPNLSFHGLIADPSRAFIDETWGKSMNTHYVTTDEFSKILQQLYDNGYVLVDFDSFIVETTTEDGKTSYATQPIYLPADKKPLMLTQTLVNYETFTIDSDGDGEADAGGLGFASKLIVDANGEITCEMVDSNGNTITGAYDLVPILNAFLKAHPDFSYRGSKAILAVSGEDGVFGYRTMASVKESKGEDYYNQQVEGAKKIAQALRDDGYTIACYTYGNVDYSELSATAIQADLDVWKREVVPVLGEIDMIVFAKGIDISYNGNNNNRYNVLRDSGFRYFLGASTALYAEVTNEYVRQSRIMITGSALTNTTTAASLAGYFDAESVLNELRG